MIKEMYGVLALVCKDNMTACSGKEAEPETEEPPELPKRKAMRAGLCFSLSWHFLAAGARSIILSL